MRAPSSAAAVLALFLLGSLQACGGEEDVDLSDAPPPTDIAVDSSQAGTSYESLDALRREHTRGGWVQLGRLGGREGEPIDATWPAAVEYVKSALHGVEFTVNGTPHRYPGYTDYRLKVVLLRDSDGREYAVVFRSGEKQASGSGQTPGA